MFSFHLQHTWTAIFGLINPKNKNKIILSRFYDPSIITDIFSLNATLVVFPQFSTQSLKLNLSLRGGGGYDNVTELRSMKKDFKFNEVKPPRQYDEERVSENIFSFASS